MEQLRKQWQPAEVPIANGSASQRQQQRTQHGCLLTPMGVKKRPIAHKKRVFHPESPTTPLWRKLLFQHFDDFLNSADGIRSSDCWELEDKYKSEVVSKKLRTLYSAVNRSKRTGNGKELARAIIAMEWKGLVISGLLSLAYVIVNTSIPLTLFSLLTRVMESPSYNLATVYAHLVALYLLQLLVRAVMFLGYFKGSQMEYRVTSALRALIFETAIGFPHDQAEDKKRIGEVIRMYEHETFLIGVVVGHIQTAWGRVVLLVLEVYILVRLFDSSVLVLLGLLGVLEESFAQSIVFLITHRLDQVLQFDKIMVLEKGEVLEFGSAMELASDPSSAFYEFLETNLLTL